MPVPYTSFLPFSPSFNPSSIFLGTGLLKMLFVEEPVQFQFPVFDDGLTAGDIQELLSSLFQSGDPVVSNSGSEEMNRAGSPVDERKRKRMLSNRESARRSRLRKKRHLENLTNQVNRLRIENRELKNQFCLVTHQCHLVRSETDRLRFESVALRAKLSDLYRTLFAMQLQ